MGELRRGEQLWLGCKNNTKRVREMFSHSGYSDFKALKLEATEHFQSLHECVLR